MGACKNNVVKVFVVIVSFRSDSVNMIHHNEDVKANETISSERCRWFLVGASTIKFWAAAEEAALANLGKGDA